MIKRKKITVILIAISFLIFSLVGCSSQPKNNGDEGKKAAGGPAVNSDTLIIAAVDIPNTLDPEHDVQDQVGVASVHSTLVEFKYAQADGYTTLDPSYGVEPLLAESWVVSEDGRTYNFKLREGIKSKDGNELTSEDVKYTFERHFAIKAMGLVNTGLCGITDIDQLTIKDKYNFEIKIDKPVPYVLQVFAIGHLAILDSVGAKEHSTNDDPWAEKWVQNSNSGFGPYFVTEMSPGQQMILESNPNWFEGEPGVKKVIYKSIPESASRLQLLLSGDVDIALQLSMSQIEEVRKNSGLKVIDVDPSNLYIHLFMNNGMEPFNNVKVRQAISYAIPYEDIVNTVFYGKAKPGKSPLSDLGPDYDSEAWNYDTNISKAKELLAEAGFPDGFKSSITVNLGQPETIESAVLITSALKDIGIDVQINKVPAGVFGEGKNAKKWPMLIEKNYSIVDTAAFSLPLFWGPGSLLNWSDWGKGGYGDYAFWDEVEKALYSNDPKIQAKVWKEAQTNITDQASAAFLVYPGYHIGMKEELKGFAWHPDNHLRFRFFQW